MMLSRNAVTTLSRRLAAPGASAALASAPSLPSSSIGAVRYLNVHEYISMELMQSHGIATPISHVAETPEEAENIFRNIMNKRKYCLMLFVASFPCTQHCVFMCKRWSCSFYILVDMCQNNALLESRALFDFTACTLIHAFVSKCYLIQPDNR